MGAGVCLGIMLVVYLFGGQGAGDAKLAATLGALLGPEKGFWILMSTHLIAGVLVLLWSLSRIVRPRLCSLCHLQLREFSLVFHDIPTVFGSKDFLKRRVPLAPFFALGTAATLLGVLMP